MGPRCLLTLIAAAYVASAPVRAGVLPQDDRNEVEAVRILRTLRDPDHAPIETLADSFTRFARNVPDFLFEILRDRKVPDRGEGEQILSIYQRDLILAGFERLGRAGTLSSLSASLSALDSASERLAAVEVLGSVGCQKDLGRVFDLALDAEEEEGLSRSMADALRRATTSTLERDPESFRWLSNSWRSAPREVWVTLILAVGETEDSRGLEFLSEVIASEEDLATAAAAQIQRVGASSDAALNEALGARLRDLLDPNEPDRSRTICQALGKLEDLPSVPQLIGFLDSESRGLRGGAHSALKHLTGLSLPLDPLRWSHWYQEESAWMQGDKIQAFRRLRSGREGDVARALHEIEAHPLARGELLAALGELLESSNPSNQVQACAAAGRLERPELVPALIEVLDDPSLEAGKAAHEALRKLTGLDLPDDPSQWRERFPS